MQFQHILWMECILTLKMYLDAWENGSQWVRDEENMVDEITSPI